MRGTASRYRNQGRHSKKLYFGVMDCQISNMQLVEMLQELFTEINEYLGGTA